MIIHFSHDEEPVIAFSSLSKFLNAMHEAGTRGQHIDYVQPEQLSIPLEDSIRALAAEESSDDRTFLLTTYLAVCAELRGETKAMLARDKSFFVREALAEYLQQHPKLEDLAFAEELAKERHTQVARAASAAVAAIRRMTR
jgi:predicted DNA-binding protein